MTDIGVAYPTSKAQGTRFVKEHGRRLQVLLKNKTAESNRPVAYIGYRKPGAEATVIVEGETE